MKVQSRQRVYWIYFILAILFFFFYLLVLDSSPYNTNYNYSEALIRNILNSPRYLKVTYLYLLIVSSSSFVGFIISNIIKAISYRKSFIISFLTSTIIGLSLFTYYVILR